MLRETQRKFQHYSERSDGLGASRLRSVPSWRMAFDFDQIIDRQEVGQPEMARLPRDGRAADVGGGHGFRFAALRASGPAGTG